MTDQVKICVGVILGAHGIRGQVRLRSLTDDPESIFKYKPLTSEDGQREFRIKRQGISRDDYIASITGVDDRNASEALQGTKLWVDSKKLPKPKKGEFYEKDLVGLNTVDAAGKPYGKILTVHDYGAGTFFEIGTNKKDSFMLPFTDACVTEIDAEGGKVTITVPEGWLAAEKPEGDQE